MKRVGMSAILMVMGALGACSTTSEPAGMDAPANASASAELRDRNGAVKAQATATQVGTGVRVRLDAMNMAQGTYAAHVHTVGSCVAPDFTSAGGHWNPTQRQHGKDNPAGMHKGDLPNLIVGADGRGMLEYTVDGATVSGSAASILDADGGAIVIHASPDDYRTDPTGNAGGRQACGVFG